MNQKTKKTPQRFGMHADPSVDILEPLTSIKYVGRLFKLLGAAIFLLMITEVALGVSTDGLEALPVLLLEVAQLLVIAGLLWGGGDITYLIVETHKDIRATRVQLWQLSKLQEMQLSNAGTAVSPVDPEHPVDDE